MSKRELRCLGYVQRRVIPIAVCLTASMTFQMPVTAGDPALSPAHRKCLNTVYNGARMVMQQECRGNTFDCIRHQVTPQDACIATDRPKSIRHGDKLIERMAWDCGRLPPYGVNPDVLEIIDAAQTLADDVIRNQWGAPVDPNGSTCDYRIARAIERLATKQWKGFRKCVKDANTIGGPGSVQECIKTGIRTGTADEGPDLIEDVVDDSCVGLLPRFDGVCDGLLPAAMGQCIVDNVECEVCRAMNTVTLVGADCTEITQVPCPPVCGDGLLQSPEECEPDVVGCAGDEICTPACACESALHKCTFDGAVDNSSAQFCYLNTCPAAIDISGAVDIGCDPTLQDANGKRPCQTQLQAFDPFVLSGVGTVCIDPVVGCPDGEIDCDGGNALDLDMIADHEIGACTSNAGCDGQCSAYCGGIGQTVYDGACENFCQGGSRADQPCICDRAGSATCGGGIAGVNDCPGSLCEGKDNEVDADCHCTCFDDGAGPGGPAGATRLRLGIALRLEADPVCDNSQVLWRMVPQCIPLTTGTATVTQFNANESPGTQGPWTESGVAGNCAVFDTSTTAGFEFASGFVFMDSTYGDAQWRMNLDCQ